MKCPGIAGCQIHVSLRHLLKPAAGGGQSSPLTANPQKALEGWGFRGVFGVKSHNQHATSSGTHSWFEQENRLSVAWPH